MKNKLVESIIDNLDYNESPQPEELKRLLSIKDSALDDSFVDFITSFNGCEGFISENHYIQLWKIDDIVELNPYYKDFDESQRYFFFGSDGSNLGYGFDKTSGKIIAIDFLEIGYSEPEIIGETFTDFIINLHNDRGES